MTAQNAPIRYESSVTAGGENGLNLGRLNAAALRGLAHMFNEESGLFCYRLNRAEAGLTREGTSPRYTVITLLGLHRLETAGVSSPFNIHAAIDTLLEDGRWANSIGDLGLLLWLCAVAYPEKLPSIIEQFSVKEALGHAGDRNTTDLAWFLSGLAHYNLTRERHMCDLSDQAVETYSLLKDNQTEGGLFGHSARKRSMSGLLRGHIGCFADQVYPIYALAKAAQGFHIEKAATRAFDCALALCRLQGPLGQWWWHYDSRNSRVVGRYPVYSVHQEGMAPMALFALGEVLRSDYGPWIYKGLQWISGTNELNRDMRDDSADVIWRCAYHKNHKRYLETAWASLTTSEAGTSSDNLQVLYECRPYELGWLLYAFGNHGLK